MFENIEELVMVSALSFIVGLLITLNTKYGVKLIFETYICALVYS